MAEKKLNYKGIDIRIEYEKGERKPDGDSFSDDSYGWPMYADYGYIEGTFANDKEEIDVYVGPDRDSDEVFIATLLKRSDEDGGDPEIDEWKVLLGFKSYEEVQEFMSLQYGNYMLGVIYRSSLEDINLNAELSRLKLRKELLYMKEKEDDILTISPFKEVGQYGGTPVQEKLIITS